MSGTRRPVPQPGIAAKWPSYCARCDGAIAVGNRIVFLRGRAIHASCASGGDDE